VIIYTIHKAVDFVSTVNIAWKTIQRLMTGVKEGKPAGPKNGPREMGVEGHRDPRQSPTPQGEEGNEEGAEDNVEVPHRNEGNAQRQEEGRGRHRERRGRRPEERGRRGTSESWEMHLVKAGIICMYDCILLLYLLH
jgi:hypothetical protein